MRHAPLLASAFLLVAGACVDLDPPVLEIDGGGGDGAVMDAPAGDDGDGDAGVTDAGDAAGGSGGGGGGGGSGGADGSGGAGGADAGMPPRPVGHWRLDVLMNLTTNEITPDSAASAHPGIIEGGPTLITSVPASLMPWSTRALDFTGSSDDAIRIPDAAALRPTTALTISMWVRFASSTARVGSCGSVPSGLQYLIHRRNTRTTVGVFEGFALVRQQDNRFGFILTNTSGERGVVSATASSISTGIWHHVVATYGSGQMRLYVNNVLQGQAVLLAAPIDYDSSGALYIARSGECGQTGSVASFDALFNGAIDDVRIYDFPIPAAEVDRLFRGGE